MNSKAEKPHSSVLLGESLELLEPRNGDVFVDATLGAGGHSEEILRQNPDSQLIGFDQDQDALSIATERLSGYADRTRLVHANFASLKQHVSEADGIIADLGVSSMQFDRGDRGFSFRIDAPLDMRMNPDGDSESASELLSRLSQEEIANAIYEYGEERFSRRIARRIVLARESGEPVETTKQLAALVRRSVPRKKNEKVHPATKTFQALRILVNRELDVLETFVRDACDILKPGGRIVIISFHSLEDRIVKRAFQNLAGKCFCPRGFPECVCGSSKLVNILTRKPITPSAQEIEDNPRSRSAKLRAARRIDSLNKYETKKKFG